MHATKCFKCDFYHLSIKYLSSVMKISAKSNTMQNKTVLLFVRSLPKLKALELSKVGLSSIKHQRSKKLTRWIEAT